MTRVVLSVYIHCQNCGNRLRRKLLKMKGVSSVEVDTSKSEVKVRGSFDAEKLVEYVNKKLGKRASVVAVNSPRLNVWGCYDCYPTSECLEFFYASQAFSDENVQACAIL